MKKSNYVAIVLSTIGVLVLGMGMCMCLIEEWNQLQEGILVGLVGLLILGITVLIYRRMELYAPIQWSLKKIAVIVVFLLAIGFFGAGMSLTMVFHQMVIGILCSIVGIAIFLGLIPLCVQIK